MRERKEGRKGVKEESKKRRGNGKTEGEGGEIKE